jgi:PadR family transcriptional regulator, regulatory protein PadR
MAKETTAASVRTDRERKKGAADLLVLSLLTERERHGYELAKLIEQRSGGDLVFHVASLYTVLYRLEDQGLIRGRWVEKAGERRRRFYRLTAQGEKAVERQRQEWRRFVVAVDRVMDPA